VVPGALAASAALAPTGADADIPTPDTAGWSCAKAGALTANKAAATQTVAQAISGALNGTVSEPGEKREIGNVVDGQRNMPEILSPRG
jgi:hypothetical protein